MLLLRALISFLTLPGVVAFAIPLYLFDTGAGFDAFARGGAVVLLTGMFILAWCVRDFYVLGRGTLAPWDPPKRLVVLGLYRYSRNPMYVGVLTILAGWALGFRSLPHAYYALVMSVAFHVRVLVAEEPFLARTYGEAWTRYKSRVPRWLLPLRAPAGTP